MTLRKGQPHFKILLMQAAMLLKRQIHRNIGSSPGEKMNQENSDNNNETIKAAQPEENAGGQQNEKSDAAKPASISLTALGFYNFFFILLSLHAPYRFLHMLPNLVITSQGLDYDMGGIFPHLGSAIAAAVIQTGLALLITAVAAIARLIFRRLDAFVVSFLSICGLQVLVYHRIYFDARTDPAILEAFGPFTISWAFLALFIFGSIFRLHRQKSGKKPD